MSIRPVKGNGTNNSAQGYSIEYSSPEEERVLRGQTPNVARILQLLRRLFAQGMFNMADDATEIGSEETIMMPSGMGDETWDRIKNQVGREAAAVLAERGTGPTRDEIMAGMVENKVGNAVHAEQKMPHGGRRKSKGRKTKSKSRKSKGRKTKSKSRK